MITIKYILSLKQSWWIQVLVIAIAAISYIEIAGFVGISVLPSWIGWSDGIEPVTEAPEHFPAWFVRYDSGYYLQIAEHGYRPDGPERAFFPLYPVITRFASAVFGISILWSGLFVSILSFVASGLLLYRWARIDYDHRQALLATVVMYIFPMSFFFIAFYAESLLLLMSIASVYLARRGRFVASGCAIALAGFARPTAFLLAIPYILEFVQQRDFTLPRWIRFGAGALIAPAGMLGYLAYIGYQSGEINLLQVYQDITRPVWKGHSAWPWENVISGFHSAIFGVAVAPDWFSRTLVWHDLLFVLVSFAVSIWALPRLRWSAAAFLLIGILYFAIGHGPYGYAFWSDPRRVAALFPLYMALALLVGHLPTHYRWIPLGVSVFLLGLLAAWFASGHG